MPALLLVTKKDRNAAATNTTAAVQEWLRGEHEFAATKAEFEMLTSYFRAPHENEGIQVEIYRP